ncbi:Rho GTPase activation protein [Chytriomyces sp. MP71]|nr:Rho GTPase activation protein [Chytriomyces sp. MP71]
MNVALCKSIEYSSHACANNDTTFNLRRIPILVHECVYFLKVNGLKSNGIFRVNGSERRMAQLALVFDQGPKYGLGFTFEGYTVYDVADFLKRYVRSLPEPLLTTELYPFFLKCLEVPVENGSRIKAFRWLLMLLPPPHLVLLEQLLELFSLVVGNADTNQMTSNNLARIFSPNILKPRSEKQALEEFQSCSFVVEFMIENWEQFSFTAKDMRPFEILDMSYLPKRKAYVPPVPVPPVTSAEAGGAVAAESYEMPPLPVSAQAVSPPMEAKAGDGHGMERTFSY